MSASDHVNKQQVAKSKYGLIWGNEHGVNFVDTQGASIEDWKKHGPACDYCGAGAGKACLEGCQGH